MGPCGLMRVMPTVDSIINDGFNTINDGSNVLFYSRRASMIILLGPPPPDLGGENIMK